MKLGFLVMYQIGVIECRNGRPFHTKSKQESAVGLKITPKLP